MTTAFRYRPKFIDIRINKPDAAARLRAPEERACDHIGCLRAGGHRAPKSREMEGQFWWFCTDHAAEYNRRWNYFEGMTEAEYAAFDSSEAVGHRPTWTMRPSAGDRESAIRRKFYAWRSEKGGGPAASQEPRRRHLTRQQIMAFETLGLEETSNGDVIRTRYAELIKRYHPDSNGGDRSMEAQLSKVRDAYQLLKTGGLV